MTIFLRGVFAGVALCLSTAPAFAASVAYRFTDLDLRDPHMFVSVIGCMDITNSALAGYSVNGDLQTRIQTDADADGLLDYSLLIVFDPLDQSGAGGPIRLGESSCTAPLAGTACGPAPYENLLALGSTNGASGTCLGTIPGTTHGYSPSPVSSAAPCFVSADIPSFAVALFAGGGLVTLRSVRVAATYVGSPASSLVNGMLRGFLTEADANATILPGTLPLFGGQALSALLPGGDPPGAGVCCAAFSDIDLGPSGERGWWMYFNFVAQPVPYSGPSVGVENGGGSRLSLASANPSRAAVALTYRLETDGPASITVHDLGGRRVARPLAGWQFSGTHRLVWDGRLDGGGAAAAGLYVIRLASPAGTVDRKVVLLR
jgi:hypothetical protein